MSQSSFVGYKAPQQKLLWTLSNNYPHELFDEDVILFIQSKISETLFREFKQRILVSRADIIRTMGRVVSERFDGIKKVIQRTVMEICSDFRREQLTIDKHLKWEAHYNLSQRLYDPSVESSKSDPSSIKLANRLGLQRVGGTARFYFT